MYLICVLFSLLQSSGASFQNVTPREFFEKAPIVVRVISKKSEPRWGIDEQSNKKIFTYTDFEVLEQLKGDVSQNHITARELGGEIDGLGLSVPGAAHFEQDHEYIVSLAPSSEEGVYRIFALSQGVLDIQRNGDFVRVQGVLTRQKPVDFAAMKAAIKKIDQPTAISSSNPVQTAGVVAVKVPPSSNSSSLWIWIGLIIIGTGTWMISRK